MHDRDTLGIVIYATQGALGAAMGAMILRAALRARRARTLARGSKPIPSPVVFSKRTEDDDDKSYPWGVETRYEVPGLGTLTHRKRFKTEGKAILYGRLHKIGVVDPVIPNLVEPGQALLPADLQSSMLGIALLGLVVLALGLWQAYAVLR
jgi:hypothetical protein